MNLKRFFSLMLAFVMSMGLFSGMNLPVSAASDMVVYTINLPRASDVNQGNWGHGKLNLMGNWVVYETNHQPSFFKDTYEGDVMYCIEPGVPVSTGDEYMKQGENYWDDYPPNINPTIPSNVVKWFIGRILLYGWQGKGNLSWNSSNPTHAKEMSEMIATQLLVWETVVGERDEDFNLVSAKAQGKNAVKEMISPNHPLCTQIFAAYNALESAVKQHRQLPSFLSSTKNNAQTVALSWNGAAYSTTLTDTNNVLAGYLFTSGNSGVKFTVNGNKLTIATDKAPTVPVSISAEKINSQRVGFVTWSDGVVGGGTQDFASYGAKIADPIQGYVNFEVKTGSLKLIKTAEDGKVSGIRFTITGNGINQTVTTNSKGEILIDNLQAGTYTITEQSIDRYKPQESKTVTIVSGQTASVFFNNSLKRGSLTVTKTAEDGLIEGIKFRLTGTSLSGLKVDEYAVTDKNGTAKFTDVLIGTDYVLSEVDTPNRYVVPANQTANIEWNKVTSKIFSNTLKKGSLTVTKTAEDGLTEGIKFRLTGTSLSGIKVDEYAVTDKKGIAKFTDVLIGTGYVLTEVDTPNRYVVPTNQTANIEWNKVTDKTFRNTLKKGSLTVTKTAEDGLVEGIKFRITGTSLSGIKVDEYAVTDKNGIVKFTNVLIGTGYVLSEVDTPNRYVVPANQTANIEWNMVTNKSFHNTLKKFSATVKKVDSETQSPQGNAQLAGAVYGIYNGEKLVDTYTTDKNGRFKTKDYIVGDNFTLREITPPEGYLLDTKIHKIGASAGNFTVERNSLNMTVTEQVIKGNIAIIKHSDDGKTQIENPEDGAEFEVFLKSAGSYDKAKTSEKDLLVTDENGYALSKNLPYGIYTVKQTKGWAGRELMQPFEVNISKNSETYRYLINNANFYSHIKIVKTDADSGKVIPYAGAGFQLFDPAGKQIEMAVPYPKNTKISTFYTAADGTLITPEALPYGKGYSLVEVQAPFGYVLDSTPIAFDVVHENASSESELTIVKVERPNKAQQGRITVSKTGEVFSSVGVIGGGTENEAFPTIYQPIYAEQGLAGAVFEVIADEDIVTPDGTIHHKKGDVVDKITTEKNGKAVSKSLPLGKYVLREVQAPFGMVKNNEIHAVELVYAGQEVGITDVFAEVKNNRQRVEILLVKTFEQDEQFAITGGFTKVAFGLYTQEKLLAADGTTIPVDGLLELSHVGADGKLIFTTDVPVGAKLYVQECVTDEQYRMDDTKYPVTFDYAGQDIAVVKLSLQDGKAIENKLIRGNVQGIKKDEDGNALAGAVFGLFKPDETNFGENNAILTSTSNENGKFGFENIPYGKYLVCEIMAPIGFVLSGEIFEITIAEHEEIIEIEVGNTRIRGSVQGLKKDDDGNTLAGAVFGLFNSDETTFVESTTILTSTSDENGKFGFKNIPYGKYLVREIMAPTDFVLSGEIFEITITEHGKIIEIEAENTRIRGSVQGLKKDEDGNALAGAVFGLFYPDETDFTENKAILTSTSDENGKFGFENIPYGKYLVREIMAPTGFVLSDEIFEITIAEHGEIIEIEVGNTRIRGSVQGLKKDEDGNALAGAVFGLFNSDEVEFTESTAILTSTSDENGEFGFKNIPYGKYLVREIMAPTGFVLSDEILEITISEHGETIEIEAVNKPITGELELTKTDVATGKLLPNAGFRIKNDKGETVVEGYTNAQGIAKFTLRYGKYTYEEFDAPAGYLIDTTPHAFEITEDGQIVKAVMTNMKKPEIPEKPTNPDNPKTGVNFNIALWLAIGGAGFACMITAVLLGKKRGKK